MFISIGRFILTHSRFLSSLKSSPRVCVCFPNVTSSWNSCETVVAETDQTFPPSFNSYAQVPNSRLHIWLVNKEELTPFSQAFGFKKPPPNTAAHAASLMVTVQELTSHCTGAQIYYTAVFIRPRKNIRVSGKFFGRSVGKKSFAPTSMKNFFEFMKIAKYSQRSVISSGHSTLTPLSRALVVYCTALGNRREWFRSTMPQQTSFLKVAACIDMQIRGEYMYQWPL